MDDTNTQQNFDLLKQLLRYLDPNGSLDDLKFEKDVISSSNIINNQESQEKNSSSHENQIPKNADTKIQIRNNICSKYFSTIDTRDNSYPIADIIVNGKIVVKQSNPTLFGQEQNNNHNNKNSQEVNFAYGEVEGSINSFYLRGLLFIIVLFIFKRLQIARRIHSWLIHRINRLITSKF